MNKRQDSTYNNSDTYNTSRSSVSSNNDISSYILEGESGDDNLYSIEESNLSEDRDIFDETDENEAWKGEAMEKSTTKSPVALLLKAMATPVEGWKALKRAAMPEERVASGLFYPALALASLSEFTGLFYETDFTLQTGVIRGLITFITFFFSYFCIMLLSDLVIPKSCKEKVNSLFGKEYVMFCLTTLALFYILFNIVPVMAPIFAFLPFWTIYMAVKGVKIFRVGDEFKTRVSMTMCTLIVGCPLFWNWLFTELLPLK